MTKTVQLPLHYNLKKNLMLLELKCSKKKLIGRIILVSFLVKPGNKNNISWPIIKGLENKSPV